MKRKKLLGSNNGRQLDCAELNSQKLTVEEFVSTLRDKLNNITAQLITRKT